MADLKEIAKGVDQMIKKAVYQIKEIKDYVTEHEIDIDDNDGGVGVGRNRTSISWQQVLINLFELLKPFLETTRKKYPHYFTIIDWCTEILKKLLKN